MYMKQPLQSPYCVASSLAAADAAREEASAIARDVRASVERATAAHEFNAEALVHLRDGEAVRQPQSQS